MYHHLAVGLILYLGEKGAPNLAIISNVHFPSQHILAALAPHSQSVHTEGHPRIWPGLS